MKMANMHYSSDRSSGSRRTENPPRRYNSDARPNSGTREVSDKVKRPAGRTSGHPGQEYTPSGRSNASYGSLNAYSNRSEGSYRSDESRRVDGLRRADGSRRPSESRRVDGSYQTDRSRRTDGSYRKPNPQSKGSGRPQNARKRRRKSSIKVLLLIMMILVVVGICWGASRLFGSESGKDRFVENVYINGVSLAGYTKQEGYATMEEIRDDWLNTNYALTYAGKTWDFSPSNFDAIVDFSGQLEQAWNFGHVGDTSTRKKVVQSLLTHPVYLTSEFTYDESALDAFIEQLASEIDAEATDAEITLTAEKPITTRESQNGLKLDVEATKANLMSLIETGTGDTKLPVEEVVPAVSSEDINMQLVSKFSTDVSFRNSSSRSNVRLSLNYFNALAVYPGDQISFNTVVGPRTEEAGFKKAPEYAGNETVEGVGGGVCQASTTLYDAIIMAGMEIVERHPHSMTVSYVEPSQDAAVEYGSKDFVFRNDTEHAIYIYTEVTAETATVLIYGTRPEYHYRLESVVLSEEPSTRVRYENDTEGKYVYYTTDTPYLYKKGHGSCSSEGWVVFYDWDTKQEVSREQESKDGYRAGFNVYYKGVHDPVGIITEY